MNRLSYFSQTASRAVVLRGDTIPVVREDIADGFAPIFLERRGTAAIGRSKHRTRKNVLRDIEVLPKNWTGMLVLTYQAKRRHL